MNLKLARSRTYFSYKIMVYHPRAISANMTWKRRALQLQLSCLRRASTMKLLHQFYFYFTASSPFSHNSAPYNILLYPSLMSRDVQSWAQLADAETQRIARLAIRLYNTYKTNLRIRIERCHMDFNRSLL